jgi:glycosyltransferase involved in cell wall biosynthesis
LSVRYVWALQRYQRAGRLRHLDALDFHRIEPLSLFRGDARPKYLMIHQDMAVIRDKNCDIGWRHAPWLYERIERWLFQRADRIFCVRQSAIARYREESPALAERFAFTPTWVETGIFYPVSNAEERRALRLQLGERFGIPASSQLLTSVGRFDRQKDPILLLDALKDVLKVRPNTHLLMVGDGILRPQVEASLQSEELRGHVTLLGAMPPTDIADLLRASDLFVLSSAYEGMPRVVLEALATGAPVVTTDVGEVRLVVQDGVNGAIVTERTPAHFAKAVCDVLARVQSLRGAPCERAVVPYLAETVLDQIYHYHRGGAPVASRTE